MIQVARILCPIDFSEFSRHAAHHAIAIGTWYDSRVTILHVFRNLPALNLPASGLSDDERNQLTTEMKHFVGQIPPELSVNFVVREASDVRREILAQAKTLMSDLLVIGSHGRSGFEKLLLGSVTERVVRKAPCPVMVVPAHAPEGPAAGLIQNKKPRVLCAVDFSDASLEALKYAMSLAEEADADLTLLHSIEVPPELREPVPVPADFNVDQCRAAAEAACLQRLRELVPAPVRTYCHVETAVTEGAAHRQILRMAVERNSDLIVMGVHGRGAVDVLVFGSNTARVIRGSACPVLIVPASAPEMNADRSTP